MELEQSACQDFRSRCQEAGLLQRPAALHEDDALDGLNDETTLWQVKSNFVCSCAPDLDLGASSEPTNSMH